jgi:beta-N-acetylhexosaminidase
MHMKRAFTLLVGLCITSLSFGQTRQEFAERWADSVFNSLSDTERIAQLMVVRVSEKKKDSILFYDDKVADDIKKYNIGGIVLFQGGPIKQVQIVNRLQSAAKTPLLVCIDAEWGLGMRMDSVTPLNHQIMLGALDDAILVRYYGWRVAEECKYAGIQVNFAPVVDVNNNPNNPVIGDRSFGEDKEKVALFGTQYMKGMQEDSVLACAKHFPGHGDVAVDSHLDLPVINKSLEQLDTLELYPFRKIINEGVGSVMVAHLYVPSIDNTPNRATSLSINNVTGLLKNDLGFEGLVFTDALNMKGVAKFFPGGEISVQALMAGNDILCLPEDVGQTINAIMQAIAIGKIAMEDINLKCKKVLIAKYLYGSANAKHISTTNIRYLLNYGTNGLKKTVAENAITLLNNEDTAFFPLRPNKKVKDLAYIGVGISADNAFSKRMKSDYNADVFYFDYTAGLERIPSTLELLKKYKKVVIGLHNVGRYPANNFGLSSAGIELVNKLQQQTKSVLFVFGNPYSIKNFCNSTNLIACYEDDPITQNSAVDMLEGKLKYHGHLPVTVCDKYPYGSGKTFDYLLPISTTEEIISVRPIKDSVGSIIGMIETATIRSFRAIDSLANDAIAKGATPGCVVMALKDGKIIYQRAFGRLDYNRPDSVNLETIYDIASITKIAATTLGIMKLYDAGKLKLTEKIGKYLPWIRGSNKEGLLIKDILLHQAGLPAGLPFSRHKDSACFSLTPNEYYCVKVTDELYTSKEYKDMFFREIRNVRLLKKGKYVYSDLDFILLGEIVQNISRYPSLSDYMDVEFYHPLGLRTIGFNAGERFVPRRIAPTETDTIFRMNQLIGDVDDPTASLFGGIAGHAGVFSNAHDLAVIMQMLLNGGTFNGVRYIKASTVKLFTAYHSKISRRGYGFDKPEKPDDTADPTYPSSYSPPSTFGHTGFTGTCAWVDPDNKLVYIFLSNRVNPSGDNRKLNQMNVRGNIFDAIYEAINPVAPQ